MALSKSEIKAAYPLPAYNYRVEIAGVAVGFSEVTGLSIKRETTTYKESPTAGGAPGPVVMHMPAQLSHVTISLKKGIVRTQSIATLYRWLSTTQINQVEKKDVYVRLCDENGEAVVSWKVLNAFPTKLDAPSFTANSNDAAIETMELMADSITIEET
ncbi:phage tail protein [Vitiosangium sp. GDMCC 1.1324]|uniref:phage tail protein n=1 Tax=Vitiosangium sp. (strain GDMCC 1.1324) TaxID=2138576 RepID=UPI000D35D756|nr:phage tail protein [Vitiosangium sp. GDMCC 1.1324]PTL78091.1 phage tail protein [Vitiosangium sp. GDMCC 1.1324]